MLKDKYSLGALVIIASVIGAYFVNFYFINDQVVSDDPADWAALGDYFGGVLNPFLSFVALILLIKSLTLQNEANRSLRRQLVNSERTEKLRSFEILLFHLIDSQKELLNSLEVRRSRLGAKLAVRGAEAVAEIEDAVHSIRDESGTDDDISGYLEVVDDTDQIFSILRAFYVAVRMISEKLSDEKGFDVEERKSHFLTLINFTSFSQIRLVMMAVQFIKCYPSEYLKSHVELREILDEVGLRYDLY